MPRKKKTTFETKVKKIIKQSMEKKYRKVEWNQESVGDSALLDYELQLFNIAQGDDNGARNGNQINCTGIHMQAAVVSADSTNIVRFVIYKPVNAGKSLTSDSVEVYSAIDEDKYHVYFDKLVTVSTYNPIARITYGKKWKGLGMPVKYDSSTSTDVVSNDLRLYVVSDSGAVTHPDFSGHIRIWYTDN